jgi:hypothetical protein
MDNNKLTDLFGGSSISKIFTELFGTFITYLLINVIFAIIYMTIGKDNFSTLEDEDEDDIRFFDYFYFACTTTSSVGYGDIYPITDLGKIIVMFNQFIAVGSLYLFPAHIAEISNSLETMI